MKIMIVSDTYPPDINGVARTLQVLAAGLAKHGHTVRVITTTGAKSEDGSNPVDLQSVFAIPVLGYDGIRMGIASQRYFHEQFDEFQPDALYVAVETFMGGSAVQVARKRGVRVVSGFHTNFHHYSKNYRLPLFKRSLIWYLRYFHNRTARTLTPSETTASQLREIGIENVGVLGRGVDTDLFSPGRRDPALRQTWGANEESPVAIFVGRIAPEKNLPLVVRSFQRIREQNPRARCVWVGDGPSASWLRHEYPEFIHAGARIGLDLARHYASADLFVFPSLSETFGNVLTESLASGLVSVSYDYAAARQYVRHGHNGFVAEPDDDATYLEAVDMALAHWNDKSIRQNATTTANQLSWNTIVEQFERELSGVPETLSSTLALNTLA
ncbi:glycosyltransferase family 1 protein [soil metagenome]